MSLKTSMSVVIFSFQEMEALQNNLDHLNDAFDTILRFLLRFCWRLVALLRKKFFLVLHLLSSSTHVLMLLDDNH